ncbi:hypothetical protein HMPREF0367_01019 [[Eubacterium] cylindroides ATCC 27803]|uniref:Uncharacterized protein n=1 Tax=Faecalitalea cylindroides ATCC 27803 TaxID=649755 RepID=U2PP54_9FIRM|nr:hypothetical protein HMPREF0367_01019 [[Eubacterium] cylindroides ATCC 27803] [Faecalitalea cylindroides ATCC 27803]
MGYVQDIRYNIIGDNNHSFRLDQSCQTDFKRKVFIYLKKQKIE